MPKLKLGPLPDDKPVRVAVALPAELHRLLLAYAEALAAENGGSVTPAVEKLIPPMLERFVRSDRAFQRHQTREKLGRDELSAPRNEIGRLS